MKKRYGMLLAAGLFCLVVLFAGCASSGGTDKALTIDPETGMVVE